MIKKLFLIILCCLGVCTATFAQKVKYKCNSVGERVTLPAAIKTLTKEQTYESKIPEKLHYYAKGKKIGGFFGDGSVSMSAGRIDATYNRTGTPTDYTFTLITKGITPVGKTRNVKKSNGWITEIFYRFPCSMQVTDKTGKVLKTFIINDNKIRKFIYHPQSLRDLVVGDPSAEIPCVGGFGAPLSATDFEKKKNEIYARIELNELGKAAATADKLKGVAYGPIKMSTKPLVIVLDKKNIPEYPELNKKIEEYTQTVSDYSTDPTNPVTLKKLNEFAQYFESQYTDKSPDGICVICGINASWAYLFSGDTEKSLVNYLAAFPHLGFFGIAGSSFNMEYPDMVLRKNLKEAKDIYVYEEVPTMRAILGNNPNISIPQVVQIKRTDSGKNNRIQKLTLNYDGNRISDIIKEDNGETSYARVYYPVVNQVEVALFNQAGDEIGKLLYYLSPNGLPDSAIYSQFDRENVYRFIYENGVFTKLNKMVDGGVSSSRFIIEYVKEFPNPWSIEYDGRPSVCKFDEKVRNRYRPDLSMMLIGTDYNLPEPLVYASLIGLLPNFPNILTSLSTSYDNFKGCEVTTKMIGNVISGFDVKHLGSSNDFHSSIELLYQ